MKILAYVLLAAAAAHAASCLFISHKPGNLVGSFVFAAVGAILLVKANKKKSA